MRLPSLPGKKVLQSVDFQEVASWTWIGMGISLLFLSGLTWWFTHGLDLSSMFHLVKKFSPFPNEVADFLISQLHRPSNFYVLGFLGSLLLVLGIAIKQKSYFGYAVIEGLAWLLLIGTSLLVIAIQFQFQRLFLDSALEGNLTALDVAFLVESREKMTSLNIKAYLAFSMPMFFLLYMVSKLKKEAQQKNKNHS